MQVDQRLHKGIFVIPPGQVPGKLEGHHGNQDEADQPGNSFTVHSRSKTTATCGRARLLPSRRLDSKNTARREPRPPSRTLISNYCLNSSISPIQFRHMDSSNRETRLRLLEAAGEVFAEQGYRRATVRDICSRADANIAAVNYHFGDKEKLYIRHCSIGWAKPAEISARTAACRPPRPPEQRLHAFIRSWLFRMLGKGMPAWHGKLMAREMSEPTAGFDTILAESIRPMANRLNGHRSRTARSRYFRSNRTRLRPEHCRAMLLLSTRP